MSWETKEKNRWIAQDQIIPPSVKRGCLILKIAFLVYSRSASSFISYIDQGCVPLYTLKYSESSDTSLCSATWLASIETEREEHCSTAARSWRIMSPLLFKGGGGGTTLNVNGDPKEIHTTAFQRSSCWARNAKQQFKMREQREMNPTFFAVFCTLKPLLKTKIEPKSRTKKKTNKGRNWKFVIWLSLHHNLIAWHLTMEISGPPGPARSITERLQLPEGTPPQNAGHAWGGNDWGGLSNTVVPNHLGFYRLKRASWIEHGKQWVAIS